MRAAGSSRGCDVCERGNSSQRFLAQNISCLAAVHFTPSRLHSGYPDSILLPMNATLEQPTPRNLREQILQRISAMPEKDIAQVYELLLLAEKLKVRCEISQQAAAENAQGMWVNLPEFINAYRSQRKSA